MGEITLMQEDIMLVLSRFYAKARRDAELGPVFNDAVKDWSEHLQRLEDFWSSLMLTTGRYKGNPVAMHLIHADRIEPHMFVRWLKLWEETTNELVSADVAWEMQTKAARIAERLNTAMHGPEAVIVARRPEDDGRLRQKSLGEIDAVPVPISEKDGEQAQSSSGPCFT
ncbi:group III truncated hemoglobin [Rhizobium sp. SSA_523]|uniref:group III truncated hemoglobin n=1 Tax=Rhizobium sp. SSA_523 TaxID=2952477 RepID=UPI00209159F0|nr:group III truncated hemoglobin [Rhizobium sp. SSA_523]MCO5734318.1 group III truncated hemoglobin [Rhizobium sp. SSA_523]WKC21022.1 group III truncated hemoglobin [Rhizobium sp. SSA_523]